MMLPYLLYIWKRHFPLAVFAVIFNLSFLSVWCFASFFYPKLWFVNFLLLFGTWGIALFIVWDSKKSKKEAGLIAVAALIINVYAVIWYFTAKAKLTPLSLQARSANPKLAEVELCDSRVTAIIHTPEKRSVLIRLFPALIHKDKKLWTQTVEILLLGTQGPFREPICPLTITECVIQTGGRTYETRIALPFHEKGASSLELLFHDGTTLTIAGNEIKAISLGPMEYFETSSGD